WCRTCGGHVLTEHPTLGVTDVYAAVLDGFTFEPGVHVNYQETVLPMRDGLAKLKDFPAEMGGSGVRLSE
ncbi:MAG TPA: GFA family protein, partial [Gammaproteobacteria bacterium]